MSSMVVSRTKKRKNNENKVDLIRIAQWKDGGIINFYHVENVESNFISRKK